MATVPTPEEGLRQRLDAETERLRTESGGNFSRYALTRLHPNLEKKQVRFGVWNAPAISLENPHYRVVRLADVGRLDNISVEYYDDPRYWWAIAHVNRIRNPFEDMVIGMVLIIPRKELILEGLETGNPALFEAPP